MAAAPESDPSSWWIAIGTVGGAVGGWLMNWLGVFSNRTHKHGVDAATLGQHSDMLAELRLSVAQLRADHATIAERVAGIPPRSEFEAFRREVNDRLDRLYDAIMARR